MIKLGGLVSLKPINEADYVHIGYGKYKEKGKEKDPNAQTFKKDDNDKFTPISSDKAAKGGDSSAGKDVPKVNIFDKPKAEPKSDGMETVKSIAAKTGLRAQALAGWADENGVNLSKVSDAIDSKKLKPMDLMTAIAGNPNNKYSKDIIAKYSQDGGKEDPSKEEPKSNSSKTSADDLAVDKVVYNTRTKTVGIVRLPLERGEVKTDADGNVNADELEPYNPTKYPHQKDAKVAPSTQKEVDKRGLMDTDSTDGKTTKDSTGDRAGNLEVNKKVRAKAQKMGITPAKLGKEEYLKKMAQAAVAALTDANFHSEARQLVADLEGKPEMADKPDYPKMDDPKYDEKMKVIRAKYDSVYSEPDDDAEEIGLTAANEASWDGQDALDSIAFDLKMNGFKALAAKLQSVIKESKSTKLKDLV